MILMIASAAGPLVALAPQSRSELPHGSRTFDSDGSPYIHLSARSRSDGWQPIPTRPTLPGQRARLHVCRPELDAYGVRPRLRYGIPTVEQPVDEPFQSLRRGSDHLFFDRVRLRPIERRIQYWLLHHASEEKPGFLGAAAREGRTMFRSSESADVYALMADGWGHDVHERHSNDL